MPIEIRELHIKALVRSERSESPGNSSPTVNLAAIKKELVTEVTEEVLRRIMLKSER